MRDPDLGSVILCADDYGISAGVSRGILELLAGRHINATSAMVNFSRWPEDAARLTAVRGHCALGLHLNLTSGAPLGAMPRLAPGGAFPSIAEAMRLSLSGRIDVAEVEAETLRQLRAFEAQTGFKPDHVDGHQHVHALPGIRHGVLAAMAAFYGGLRPLVRNPTDGLSSILRRRSEISKATLVAALSGRFRSAALKCGFFVNRGFSGFSAFDTRRPYDAEIAAALRAAKAGHVVMCHPGYADAELASRDPVLVRREQELAVLRASPRVIPSLALIAREPDTAILDWSRLGAKGASGNEFRAAVRARA